MKLHTKKQQEGTSTPQLDKANKTKKNEGEQTNFLFNSKLKLELTSKF